MEEKIQLRNLTDELTALDFTEEQAEKILEWVDTIPILICGDEDNVQVRVNRGGVVINEDMIDSQDLSFNELPDETRLQYLWYTNKLYNPFKIPVGAKLGNPFTGEILEVINAETKETKPVIFEDGEEFASMNPFNMNLSTKFVYKDNKPVKRFTVDENNEWVEDMDFNKEKDE
jgi:hypothetical protein